MIVVSGRNDGLNRTGREIRWGIIGCGDVVERKSGDSLQSVPGSRITAVMRRTPGLAEDFARRHGVPFWTQDARELIARPDVDAVYVATPPDTHLDYALAVCAAGKPCLVEKPAGRSAEETRRMVDAFRAADLPLFVSYYRRLLPKFLRVKQILDSARIGTVTSIDYRLCKPASDESWRQDPRVAGGGRFYDLAGHVLDLFDDWFGPLEQVSGQALNAFPDHDAEDVVAMSFRTAGGALGTALFNFAAPRSQDELVIEGLSGRLRLRGLDCWSPLGVELRAERAPKATSAIGRNLRALRKRIKLVTHLQEQIRFERLPFAHRPMVEAIVAELSGREAGAPSGDAALRTARAMDAALADYYEGRGDAFWERPSSWNSLRATAARSADPAQRRGYVLSPEELERFAVQGYLGPFPCDAPWRAMRLPARARNHLHAEDPRVFLVCAHPCFVDRVQQLLGAADGVALFKSRFWVKPAHSETPVPWHQDVGAKNGGYLPDGRPTPTLTAWLALDDVTRSSGAVQVVPGSHHWLIGDYRRNIRADLEGSGVLADLDLESAPFLEAKAGEFFLFHSWILHASGPNRGPSRRAGFNARYAAVGQETDPELRYVRLLDDRRD
jgi:predicted dehydrogenase